jgi:Helix-turn-helix
MKGQRTYKLNAELIDALRTERGLSWKKLAEKADVHVKTLTGWIKGKAAFLEKISVLATQLGTTTQSLIIESHTATDETATRMELAVNVQGILARPEQAGLVVTMTEEMIAKLGAYGIAVQRHRTTMALEQHSGLMRTIIYMYGMLENGNPFWLFAAVNPARYSQFLSAHKAGTLDLHQFRPYGEIIVSGEGKGPPDEITAQVAEMYDTTPEILMQAMNY